MRLLLVSLLWSLVLSPVRAAEPPVRSLEAREREATSDAAVSLLVAESFASSDDAEAYVAKLRRQSGIDLARTFGPYGYEVTPARSFLSVAESEKRLLTDDKIDPGHWVKPFLCIAKAAPERARAAAKALGLEDRGFNEMFGCNFVVWPKPVPRADLRALAKRVESAGYRKELMLEIADVVIVLGKAVAPPERAKLEALTRKHRIPVRSLESPYSEGD